MLRLLLAAFAAAAVTAIESASGSDKPTVPTYRKVIYVMHCRMSLQNVLSMDLHVATLPYHLMYWNPNDINIAITGTP